MGWCGELWVTEVNGKVDEVDDKEDEMGDKVDECRKWWVGDRTITFTLLLLSNPNIIPHFFFSFMLVWFKLHDIILQIQKKKKNK